MTYLPQHLRTQPENEINDIQQDRISRWRRGELASGGPDAWRLALARAHRQQEMRLQAAYVETARAA